MELHNTRIYFHFLNVIVFYKAMKIDGYLEGSDVDYAVIRRAMENNDAFFQEREKTAQKEQAGRNALPATTEPAMQAASASSQAMTATDNAGGNVSHSHSTQVATPRTNTGSRNITVNIELPADLFSQGLYTGPDSLTINLKIPQKTQ